MINHLKACDRSLEFSNRPLLITRVEVLIDHPKLIHQPRRAYQLFKFITAQMSIHAQFFHPLRQTLFLSNPKVLVNDFLKTLTRINWDVTKSITK